MFGSLIEVNMIPAYIMGVLTLFRRDVLLKIGGFITSFLFGYEDIDIAWRLYLGI